MVVSDENGDTDRVLVPTVPAKSDGELGRHKMLKKNRIIGRVERGKRINSR